MNCSHLRSIHFLFIVDLYRRIVLIAIQDAAGEKMTNSAYYAMRRFGAWSQYKNELRSSFALIGWSGPGKTNFVTQVKYQLL